MPTQAVHTKEGAQTLHSFYSWVMIKNKCFEVF